jgi:hypothetical protein
MMRKIGRNLLNFQQLENLLKFLVTHGEISGYASQLKLKQLKRSEAVGKQTLGKVAGQFFEQNFSACEGDEQLPEAVKEPYFRARFQFDTESTNPKDKEERLSRLVVARNELVHHFLDRINPTSKKSLIEASDYLDSQREKIVLELEYYRNHVKSLRNLREAFSEYLQSDEGRNQFMNQPNGSKMSIEMSIASETPKPQK